MDNVDVFEEDMMCPDISVGADLISSSALLCDVLNHKTLITTHIWFGKPLGNVNLIFFSSRNVDASLCFSLSFLIYMSWD